MDTSYGPPAKRPSCDGIDVCPPLPHTLPPRTRQASSRLSVHTAYTTLCSVTSTVLPIPSSRTVPVPHHRPRPPPPEAQHRRDPLRRHRQHRRTPLPEGTSPPRTWGNSSGMRVHRRWREWGRCPWRSSPPERCRRTWLSKPEGGNGDDEDHDVCGGGPSRSSGVDSGVGRSVAAAPPAPSRYDWCRNPWVCRFVCVCVCVSCVNSLTMCDLIRTDVDLRWLSGQIGTDLITCARLVNGASVIS